MNWHVLIWNFLLETSQILWCDWFIYRNTVRWMLNEHLIRNELQGHHNRLMNTM